jgi:LacI family transcriptional regulator
VPPLFLGELHAQLAQRKMHLVASETPDAQLQDEAFVPHVLQHLSSDALIIYYTQDIPPRLVEMVHQHRVPAVWVNSQQPANAVLPDEARGGALAAEHLLGLGHRRVAYLTAPPIRHFSDRARRDALAASLAEAGVELTTIQLSRDEPLDVRRCRLTQAISAADRPTAVVCYKPREARLLHMTATLAGLNAPRDLSILTFGDAVTDDTGLPLTTVQVPQVQLAREVVAMAMQQIEQPSRPLTPRLIPPTLRPAESTTTAPTD